MRRFLGLLHPPPRLAGLIAVLVRIALVASAGSLSPLFADEPAPRPKFRSERFAQTPSQASPSESGSRTASATARAASASAEEVLPDGATYYDGWPAEDGMPWEREANLEVWAPADTCGWWAETDFLLWWSEGADVPPLVTSSPAGTAANVAGVLGQPGTTVLLGGDETLATGSQAGGNVTLGWWYNPCGSALQFSYLVLSEQDSQFNADSTQIPILARPVVLNQVPAAMLVAHPDFLAGSLAVAGRTELQAMEALWRHRWYEHPMGHQLDFFLGYRYANLDESLHFDQFSRWTAPQGNIIVGTTKQLFDDFQAENEFHGANVGFAFQRTFPRWTFNVQLKVGLGNNHSSVRIDGATVTTVPNAGAATFVGGLLAQRTNIGRYSENNFAVLPELRVGIVRRLSDRVQWSAGYNALFWSNVARPGDQIDINVSQFPPEPIAPAALPAFRFGTSSYWAHGLHAGIEVSF